MEHSRVQGGRVVSASGSETSVSSSMPTSAIIYDVYTSIILGPLLFSIFIKDLFHDYGVKSVLNADDATLVIPAKSVNEKCRRANALYKKFKIKKC